MVLENGGNLTELLNSSENGNKDITSHVTLDMDGREIPEEEATGSLE